MIKNALSSIFFCCLDTERGNTSANGLASTWPSGPKPGFQEAHWNKRICCCAVTKHLFKLDIGRHVEYPKPCALSEMWHIIIYNYIIIYIYIYIYISIYICTIWFILYHWFLCVSTRPSQNDCDAWVHQQNPRENPSWNIEASFDSLSGWVENSMKASDMEGAASYILLGCSVGLSILDLQALPSPHGFYLPCLLWTLSKPKVRAASMWHRTCCLLTILKFLLNLSLCCMETWRYTPLYSVIL